MTLARRARAALARLQLSTAGRVLSVDVRANGVGLFAQVNWVLHLTRYAQCRGLVPDIRLLSENYRSRPESKSWFTDFFVPLAAAPPALLGRVRINDLSELRIPQDRDLSLQEAHDLFFSFYDFCPDVKAHVGRFLHANEVGSRTLGVHYRGTDKIDEAPRVPYEKVALRMQQQLDLDPHINAIFLASDEQDFIRFATARFDSYRVVHFSGAARSQDSTPLHLVTAEKDRYLLGRDAIADALVLSKCATLVRTSSFLSAWSCIFNPDIRVSTLNKPFASKTWFPERVIAP